jgi:hypothetical protein
MVCIWHIHNLVAAIKISLANIYNRSHQSALMLLNGGKRIINGAGKLICITLAMPVIIFKKQLINTVEYHCA